jgi:hypothetical protein
VAWLLLAILPSPAEALVDRCDLAEVNHFFDEQGRLVFDQVIYYDWSPAAGRYQVRAWRLIKSPDAIPRRDWQRGGWRAVWQDGDALRDVSAAHFRETWTQHDPELAEREHLPKEQRRELNTRLRLTPLPGATQ